MGFAVLERVPMNKPKVKLKYKKEMEAVKERGYLTALAQAKREEKSQSTGNRKRKEVGILLTFLNLPGHRHQVRSAEDYCPKAYNLGRQVIGLVDHLYGSYPAPAFLYQPILRERGLSLVYGWTTIEYNHVERKLHCEWLLTVIKGESIAKELKGILTKKEAHWFLKAPAYYTIHQNLFWAKCAAAGIPASMCEFLVEHLWLPEYERLIRDRLSDILLFYSRYQENLRGANLRRITDYVRAVLYNPGFSFKGRTYGSMMKLYRTWCRTGYNGAIDVVQQWRPMFACRWQTDVYGLTVRAVELTSNEMLAEEGRKQRHCVFTYTWGCKHGYERIFSLRFCAGERELTRLTIEVWPKYKTVEQVRGFGNREPTDSEWEVVNRWASEHGLTINFD
jgi:hypothetical protein